MVARFCARVVAAACLVPAAYVGLPAAPAAAATCPTADGVTVVVDFHELGGGVQTACVADGGGRTAASLFPAAGFPLTYVQRQQGFVCRVSGRPAEDPCVNTPPTDAYWGLWWSDGKSGSWSYATAGAGSQKVPDGGYVAFSWNGSSTRSAPGASPRPHPAQQGPTPSPSDPPTSSSQHTGGPGGGSPATPTQQSTAPGASASASGAPTATESAAPGGRRHRPGRPSTSPSGSASPSASPSASSSATPSDTSAEASDDTVPASSDPADPADDGMPAWVAPAAIVLLFGAAAAVAVVRRRRGATGS